MRHIGKFAFRKRFAMIFASLEKRLIGALLLIVLCAGALQIITQDRAFRLHSESEMLRVTASNTDRAGQLIKAVGQFRLATHLHLTSETEADAARAAGEMTDAAMRIGEQINMLRLSGMKLYDLRESMGVFDGIDRHIAAIAAAARAETTADHAALDARNAEMTALAAAIEAKAVEERERAFGQLDRSTRDWQMHVTIAGIVTVAVALLILLDLLRNILPALRRMHVALRRLADSDLDFEVEEFHLRELKALSGSLETFRRNAQATPPATCWPVRRAGCTHVQGFHYSRPIEAEAVDAYYRDGGAGERRVA